MTITEIKEKMIAFSDGNIHDIEQFVRVWNYTTTIVELEGDDSETQYILEIAAITHDIACPLCREKYGNTNRKYQETEGATLIREFLSDSGMTPAQIDRVAFLVGHHHTFEDIDGLDWQILLEADYIGNATENGYSKEKVKDFMQKIMKTESNLSLFATMNTSDQNVFTLDTAFQRRWNLRYVPNNVRNADHANMFVDERQEITWSEFAEFVNKIILDYNAGMASSEDKQLGAYFIKGDELNNRYSQRSNFCRGYR